MKKYYLKNKKINLNKNYDVIVVGGGPSGCAAAIASARGGCKTLLVEAMFALGGMGTMGLVPWFGGYSDREKIISRGIAEQVLNALKENTPHLKKQMEMNPLMEPSINPELLKRVYDNLVIESGANIIFGSQLCNVELIEDGKVDVIIVSNKAGLTAYKAEVYIDCTGDGDLATWAGAEYEKGGTNGELQPATHCFTMTNIDEYALENGPGIHFFDPASPIHKAVHSRDYPSIVDYHSCLIRIASQTFSFNTGHIYDIDSTCPNSLSHAVIHGRKMIAQYENVFAKYHPAFRNAFLCNTACLLGTRETRRIIGDYILKIDDYLERRSFSDEICRNAYGADVHSKEDSISFTKMTIEEIKKEINNRVKRYKPGESFGVPYRCLTPKYLKNVLVAGRCISTDRHANGSIRVMACCLNTGEAAGTAASICVLDKVGIKSVNIHKLRTNLKGNGAYLP